MPSEGPESHGPWDSIPVDSSETFPRRWTAQNGVLLYNAGWWFGTFFIFPYIGNVIIPTDFHIFQRGRSTTNQNGFHGFSLWLFVTPTAMVFRWPLCVKSMLYRPGVHGMIFFQVTNSPGLTKHDLTSQAFCSSWMVGQKPQILWHVYTILYFKYLKKSWISSSLFHFKFLCLQVNLTWPSGI